MESSNRYVCNWIDAMKLNVDLFVENLKVTKQLDGLYNTPPPAYKRISSTSASLGTEPSTSGRSTPTDTSSEPSTSSNKRKSSKSAKQPPSAPLQLDAEIPREEIEGDVEVIIMKGFMESLKAMNADLKGLHGKKYGFRELTDAVLRRPIYKVESDALPTDSEAISDSASGSVDLNVMETVKEEGPAEASNAAVDPNIAVDLSLPLKKRRFVNATFDATLNTTATTLDATTTSIDASSSALDTTTATASSSTVSKKRKSKKKAKIVASESCSAMVRLMFNKMNQIVRQRPKFRIEDIDFTYNAKMARRFPGTDNRTAAEKERRSKNTMAARLSRNKTKAYEIYLKQQNGILIEDNIDMGRQVACLNIYANSLLREAGLPERDFEAAWETFATTFGDETA